MLIPTTVTCMSTSLLGTHLCEYYNTIKKTEHFQSLTLTYSNLTTQKILFASAQEKNTSYCYTISWVWGFVVSEYVFYVRHTPYIMCLRRYNRKFDAYTFNHSTKQKHLLKEKYSFSQWNIAFGFFFRVFLLCEYSQILQQSLFSMKSKQDQQAKTYLLKFT